MTYDDPVVPQVSVPGRAAGPTGQDPLTALHRAAGNAAVAAAMRGDLAFPPRGVVVQRTHRRIAGEIVRFDLNGTTYTSGRYGRSRGPST